MPVPVSDWGAGEWLNFGIISLTLLVSVGILYFEYRANISLPKQRLQQRKEELYDPIDIHFLVPSETQRLIHYAKQDDRDHLLNEVILRPHTTNLVEIRIHPRARFRTTHFLFGAVYDDADSQARAKVPRPIELVDVYGQGLLEPGAKPNETHGHVINSRLQYRWNQELRWDAKTTIVVGIKIKTEDIGCYTWRITLVTGDDEDDIVRDLIVRVEEESDSVLRCVFGDHELHPVTPLFDVSTASAVRSLVCPRRESAERCVK
jgi:hypothetical protein